MTIPKYGTLEGLPQRIADWRQRLGTDRGLPWVGLGLIADLEAVMRLLNLREFGEWLRVHGASHAHWGDEILKATDEQEQLAELQEDIEKHVPVAPGQEYAEAVEQAATLGHQVRVVLEECGALSADDTETDVPALLRALLS